MPMRKDSFDELTIRCVSPADAAEGLRLRTLLWPDGADDHAQEIKAFFQGKLDESTAAFFAQDSGGGAVALLELAIRSELMEMKNYQCFWKLRGELSAYLAEMGNGSRPM